MPSSKPTTPPTEQQQHSTQTTRTKAEQASSLIPKQTQQQQVAPSFSTLSVLPNQEQQEQMLALASAISKNTTLANSNNTNSNSTSTAIVPATASTGQLQQQQQPRSVLTLVWRCSICNNDCTTIRTENRCICGHRSKQHQMDLGAGKAKCSQPGCKCRDFFYIFGEGAFILRCQCKHKHIEHSPTPPYKCVKPNCKSCTGFQSPWTCNCDHPWTAHKQVWEMRQLKSIEQFDRFGDPAFVKRGLDDDE